MPPESKGKEFGWHGVMDSGGNLHLDVYFPNGDASVNELLSAASVAIPQAEREMVRKGYIPPGARLMSSREIAEEYGGSRQYWEKLLRDGRLPSYQTAAGRITVDLWVEGYRRNKEQVDAYARQIQAVIRQIKERGKRKLSNLDCPKCGAEEKLRYSWNVHEANGVCDARGCDFRFTSTMSD